jgi:hypothetical protein
LIQIKSEELLGQRPRANMSSYNQHGGGGGGGGGMGGGGHLNQRSQLQPGQTDAECEVPKELMGAVIGEMN